MDYTEQVKAHALKHYTEGWDILVECIEDEEIREACKGADSLDEAIKMVADALYLEACIDQRNDALGAGGLETTDFNLGL